MGVARDKSVAGGYRPVLGCSRTWASVVDFSRAETPGASKHLEYAVATPTESGVLSRLSFRRDGPRRKVGRTAYSVF